MSRTGDRLGDFMDVSLADYWDRLNCADFYYQMSDDPGVYARGVEAMAELSDIADSSPEHFNLFAAFWAYHNNQSPQMPHRPQVAA